MTTWSEGHVASWVSSDHYKSPSVRFSGNSLCGIGHIKVLNCHVTSRDYVVRKSCDIVGEFP